MKSRLLKINALLLLTATAISSFSCAKSGAPPGNSPVATSSPTDTSQGESGAVQRFTDDELDELLAPIALYPDPLLAQIVPAATFFDQLEEANRALAGKSDDALIANQSWDVSVKSVAHYPQVLQMMVDKRDWTIALGQAYVNQSTDVGKAIQRLRAEAQDAGNLKTTPQQEVTTENGAIRIVPAQPKVVYVPQYDPEVVYVDKGPSTGEVVAASVIAFGAGLAIGAWLNNDWDYYGRGIYYHGWSGPGWVGVNRTFVNVNNNVYVNDRYRNVNVNRNIVNRNVASYRTNLTRNAGVRRDRVSEARKRNLDRGIGRNVDATRARNAAGASDRVAARNRERGTAAGSRHPSSMTSARTANTAGRTAGVGARRQSAKTAGARQRTAPSQPRRAAGTRRGRG